jgi:signal transduction histidine kinase
VDVGSSGLGVRSINRIVTRGSRERLTGHIWVWVGVVSGLLALSGMLTYLSGGTRTPLPHVFYIPIVVAAGAFGLRGGLATAVVAGVISGPVMPLDVDAGLSQPTSGWVIRLGFFVLVAVVVGVGRNRLLELSQARQSFLNVVSHELRTPLASVVGFASLLTDRAAELSREEAEEFAALILKEATELSNVVDHYVLEGRLSDSALFSRV